MTESYQSINYLDMTITRTSKDINIDMYRKPTNSNVTIHQNSNHPQDHKDAAYRYYANRMKELSNTKQAISLERIRITEIARQNGYPKQYINNIIQKQAARNSLNPVNTGDTQAEQIPKTKWVTFTYYSPLIRKITNLFRGTQLRVAFRPTNTITQLLSSKKHNENSSGIYEIACNTCKLKYVGQSGRDITTRYKEHIRYIRTNNSTSAYATHILDLRHEYGTAKDTLKLIQQCRKGQQMNSWENLYIQMYQQQGVLISEQQVYEHSPLYALALPCRQTYQ